MTNSRIIEKWPLGLSHPHSIRNIQNAHIRQSHIRKTLEQSNQELSGLSELRPHLIHLLSFSFSHLLCCLVNLT